ncbi:MAG: hypothetical protein FWC91_03925 [Defluviitaleaceae bacterium]|nr:hypothetical protein [Defluviitaleaceae bacterium]
MLQANFILFSRTLSRDYRWIYTCNGLKLNSEIILRDYSEFEKSRDNLLNKDHLFVRRIAKDIFLYKFLETGTTDKHSRKIDALCGYCFDGLESEIVDYLLKYVTAHIYHSSMESILKAKLETDLDNSEELHTSVPYSLDEMFEEIKSNPKSACIVSRIDSLISNNGDVAFSIIQDEVQKLLPLSCHLKPVQDGEPKGKQDNDKKMKEKLPNLGKDKPPKQ